MKINQPNKKEDFLLEYINNKPVYIFEDHATAVIPWLMIKKKIGKLPHLITLDHHTDTMEAFRMYYGIQIAKSRNIDNDEKHYEIQSQISLLIKKLRELADTYNYEEMKPLLKNLRNDEHIDLSIKLGILNYSVTLPSSSTSPTESDLVKEYRRKEKEYNNLARKLIQSDQLHQVKNLIKPIYPNEDDWNLVKTYSMPKDKMFIVTPNIKCDGLSSTEEDLCVHKYNSNVIDDCFLFNQIGLASSMTITATGKVVTEEPYILDIDLDYFHNTKSINPKNHECFYALIRHSEAITIAKESVCVLMEKEESENEHDFNSDFLLSELKKHIYRATST